jgi:SAM-dependent methyltransferase
MVDSIFEDGRRYELLWGGTSADVEFWIHLLKEFGGSVLELACGTGKYIGPADAAGLDIIGLDLSEAMLTEAHRILGPSSAPKPVMPDMRDFAFDRRFRCVLIAGNSLCHLLTTEDLENGLARIRRHLLPDGRLLIDVFVPDLGLLSRGSTAGYPFSRFVDPQGAEVVIEYTHTYDAARRLPEGVVCLEQFRF